MAKNNEGISKRKNASWVRMSASELQSLVPEKEHQKRILDYCKDLGIIAWRNNVGLATYGDTKRKVRFGVPGMPDIMGYIPSHLISKISGCNYRFAVPFFWEVKRVGGKATSLQKNFMENAKDSGSLGGIGTFEDFLTFLSLFGFTN